MMSDRETIKKLHDLAPINARPLTEQIYKKILIPGVDFTEEKKDEYKEGLELLGKLLLIHREFNEKHPFRDMIGEYLQEHGKLSFHAGQFFTPYNVCDMMVKMKFAMADMTGEPITILDPASGSGRFMLSTAKHYAKEVKMFNFLFTNIDIDSRMFTACTMNAILNGIPSVNIHGNALSLEFWDCFTVLPVGGVPVWHRVDAKEVQTRFEEMYRRNQPKRGMEKFMDERVVTKRRAPKIPRFTVKPTQKKLFEA